MKGVFKLFKKKKEEDEFDLGEDFGKDLDIGEEDLGLEDFDIDLGEETSRKEKEVVKASASDLQFGTQSPPPQVIPQPSAQPRYSVEPAPPTKTQPIIQQPVQPSYELRLLDQKIDMIRFDLQRLSQKIDFLVQRIDYLITLLQQKLYG